jgi:hypothetical protein
MNRFDYSIAARVLTGGSVDPNIINAAAKVVIHVVRTDRGDSWMSVYHSEISRRGKAHAGHYTVIVK